MTSAEKPGRPSEQTPAISTDSASDLPQDEPLTPELLEDEALRGDFMIRWSVVLLAFLLGCAEMGETQTLVHVKTGQYLAAHGFLPPRTDVFSYTTDGRPWINLGWMFDLMSAGVFGVGGAVGLTLVKAALAATAFGFLAHINLPGVSSWWSSIVAALALVVSHGQFTMRPELVTLLGVSFLLWTLSRWRNDPQKRTLWGLLPLFLFWANLDPRCFLGLVFLLLYAAGALIGSWLGQGAELTDAQRKHLGLVVAGSWLAALLNPFGWRTWSAAVTLYQTEYPAFRHYYGNVLSMSELQYRPLTSPHVWRLLDHSSVAWLVVVAAAGVSLALNHRKLRWGDTFLFLGCLAFGSAAVHEFAATSIALAAIAAWNAAAWYRATFRQTYSVTTSEVFFSRGGRAATVVALGGFAFLAIGGRIPLPSGGRVGLGWQPNFAAALESLKQELADGFDDRPFNPYMRQGDQFIWIGQKPFIDHRIALYTGGGDRENLIALHDATRKALRQPRRGDPLFGDSSRWRKTFDRFHVTHVTPSLAAPGSDYQTLFDLMRSPDWELTRLGSAAAVFYRTDRADKNLAEYRDSKRSSFVHRAFRQPEAGEEAGTASPLPNRDWPRSTGAYQSFFIRPRSDVPSSILEAQHYQVMLQEAMGGRLRARAETLAAFAHLMIQRAEAGLKEDPQSAAGFRLLGSAHDILGTLEGAYSASQKGSSAEVRRFLQSTLAYQQSLALEPRQPLIHLRLAELYAARAKHDLALSHLDRAEASLADGHSEERSAMPARYQSLRNELTARVEKVAEAMQKLQEEKQDVTPAGLAGIAYQNGCLLMAQKWAEQGAAELETSLSGQLFKAQLLVEIGRPWDASPLLERMEAQIGQEPVALEWRSLAAVVSLARGDHEHALTLWEEERQATDFQQFIATSQSLPLVGNARSWPLAQMRDSTQLLFQHEQRATSIEFNSALTLMEKGRGRSAEEKLRRLIAESPESSLRPLVRFYIAELSGELINLEPPSDQIPITADLFASEPNSDSKPSDSERPAEAELPVP